MARPVRDASSELIPSLSDALVPLSSAAGEQVSYHWKNVVISLWLGASTVAGLASHDQGLAALCEQYPRGISTINIVLPGRFSLPSPEVRAELARFMQKFAEHIVASAMVVSGDGFWASAIRGVVTAISLLSRRELKPKIFGSSRQVVEWLPPIHLERTGVAIDAEELAALLESVENAHAR